MRTDSSADAQAGYHRTVFGGLQEWERALGVIEDFAEEPGVAGMLGLDQISHFGPTGCDLIADQLRRPVDLLVELGSGYGGALRYLVDRLNRLGGGVRVAVGVDIVTGHCRVAQRITESLGLSGHLAVCASAEAVPLRTGDADAVVVSGSMPHFGRPGRVLSEAARLLRPSGQLVLTEEVSLLAAGREVSSAFRATHPADVFYLSAPEDRLRQCADAGFVDVRFRDLTEWAIKLFDERLKVIKIFRGTVERLFGATETAVIVETVLAARAEFERRVLVPALITARRPG
ncbi:MAG: class I SAM-dependent methyltransferase [Mycobacteriales bacterium]